MPGDDPQQPAREPWGERIARLEAKMETIESVVVEVRDAQRINSNNITQSIGGAKVLAFLGGLSGMAAGLHSAWSWLTAGGHQ